ncbi:MAG: PAS domain-containing protein, partial [Polyangiaceae bacterium]
MSREVELVAAIADELPVGVWVARAPDGVFVYANRAFQEIMGLAPRPEAQAGGYAKPYGIFGRDGKLYPEDKMPFACALRARASVI